MLSINIMTFKVSLVDVRILFFIFFGNALGKNIMVKTSIIVKYVLKISFSFLYKFRKHMLTQMKMKDGHPMTVCSYMTSKV